jgi:hypothetical protein
MRYIIIFLITFILLYSCNPVKKVLNDPVKTNEVASELIRRGYCSNDTTIITSVTDTVYINDNETLDTLIFEQGICNFDTVLKSGTRIKFQNGMLFIREKKQFKTRVITKQVNNYIRDTSYENLLKQDIAVYSDSIIQFKATIAAKNEQIITLDQKLDKTKWYLILVIVAVVGTFVWRIYKKLNFIA